VVVGWAILRWQTKGRDPSYLDDASVLLAAPPDGMTAATATIVDSGPAPTAFMAALLDLASRDEIAFRDETPDTKGAHRIGIEIHGVPTDDPRVRLNRRRPVGEGEAWLLANLKGFAASGAAGLGEDERAMASMGAVAGLFGFAASALANGSAGTAPGALVDGMSSGPVADPQALLLAALTREGKPVPEELRSSVARREPMMALMREVMSDPDAISADPQAFASRVEAATGRAPTSEEMASLTTWLHEHEASVRLIGAEMSGAPTSGAYVSAARALEFHPPIGFATLVENYARRKGWVTGFSFVSRWKWHGLAAAEVVVGLLVAAVGTTAQGLAYGAGLGIAAGGVATWFVAPYMASRTREGAVMKAELAAYRRTLKATFDASATLDDAVTAAGMPWLETPDQALVWGVALGLRPEIEALLKRTTSGMTAGTVSRTAFLPRWINRAAQALATGVSGIQVAAPPPPGHAPSTAGLVTASDPSSAAIHDFVDVFAGIERIGTVTPPARITHR
jgi:hypothetical protein